MENRKDLLARWAALARELETRPPDPNVSSEVEVYRTFVPRVRNEEYVEVVRSAADALREKKPPFPNPVRFRARRADRFVPPAVMDRLLPRIRAALPLDRFPRGQDLEAAAAKAGGDWVVRLKTARDPAASSDGVAGFLATLQAALDVRPRPELERLQHLAETGWALALDGQLADPVRKGPPSEAVAGFVELFEDRVRDVHREALAHADRFGPLKPRLLSRLGPAAAALPPDADFRALERFLADRADPKAARERLGEAHKADIAGIKAQLSEAITAGRQGDADVLGARLKAANAAYQAAVASLGDAALARLSRGLLRELVPRNPLTQEALEHAQKAERMIRSDTTGSVLELEMRPGPAVLDAFTSLASRDCSQGRRMFFGTKHAHNLKVWDLGARRHVGNVYALEGTAADGGRILHLDAIQIPLPLDHAAMTLDLCTKLWASARAAGFSGLTANEIEGHVSNHASVSRGFEANYEDRPSITVEFPAELAKLNFWTFHGIHGVQVRLLYPEGPAKAKSR